MSETKETQIVTTTEKKNNLLVERLKELSELDNFQKHVLGTKKDGNPRAVIDVVLELTGNGKDAKKKKDKKKKKKSGGSGSAYAFYLDVKKGKKKKKKKNNHWHIPD